MRGAATTNDACYMGVDVAAFTAAVEDLFAEKQAGGFDAVFVAIGAGLGKRVDIAAVYGLPPARAILARLKACDEIMDGKPGTGDGRVLSPKDEWARQPGDLPV